MPHSIPPYAPEFRQQMIELVGGARTIRGELDALISSVRQCLGVQTTRESAGSFGDLQKSIAVLPLDNISDDADQEYFSDGLTEDIITDLSLIPGLFVVARNSTFTYKGKYVDVRQIGQEMGVHLVAGQQMNVGLVVFA